MEILLKFSGLIIGIVSYGIVHFQRGIIDNSLPKFSTHLNEEGTWDSERFSRHSRVLHIQSMTEMSFSTFKIVGFFLLAGKPVAHYGDAIFKYFDKAFSLDNVVPDKFLIFISSCFLVWFFYLFYDCLDLSGNPLRNMFKDIIDAYFTIKPKKTTN